MIENKATIVDSNNKATNSPVTVKKTVTIMRKENSSAYFRRNAKFMPEGKVKIGSSINGVNRLKNNIQELTVYMSSILGLAPTDPEFGKKVDMYLNNISAIVPEGGLGLDISFVYNSEKDHQSVSELEEAIYAKFNKANKSTSKERDLAFKVRDEEIISLESTKYKLGSPVNAADYLLWRYCLVYADVANDIALTNNAGGIRFYIYDSEKEKYKEKIMLDIRNKAMAEYLGLINNPSKMTNVLWVHLANTGVSADSLDDLARAGRVEAFSKADPNEFLKLCSDSNLLLRANIERMIQYNILKRLPGSSIIVDDNNDTIGQDMESALQFFKNTEQNKAKISVLQSKLKQYSND